MQQDQATEDPERGGDWNFNGDAFSNKVVRRRFVRKVYGILTCQLALTFGIIMIFTYVESIKQFAQKNKWLIWVAFVPLMILMIALVCCEKVRRKAPANYILLGLFTLLEGFMLGVLTAHFDINSIWIAIAITMGLFLVLTLFAFVAPCDFTKIPGWVLIGLLIGLAIAMLVLGFLLHYQILLSTKWTLIGFGIAGGLIFCLYIVFDTQLMLGGKHKYALDPEEYVFAALNIYLDIINLFMYVLLGVGGAIEG